MFGKARTQAEWDVIHAKQQKLAEEKRITYKTYEDWNKHKESCATCFRTVGMWCDDLRNILDEMSKQETSSDGEFTCPHCKEDWSEDEYWYIGEGDEVTCVNCGMINKVTLIETTTHITVEETGKFEPSYLVVEED